MTRLTTHAPAIWTIADFLSAAECRDIIEAAERSGFVEATVGLPGGARMQKGTRDNDRTQRVDAQLAQSLAGRLSHMMPSTPELDALSPAGLDPRFRVYRYGPSQRFKRHIDGRAQVGDAHSRVTFMVYLNDDYAGGQTVFDDMSITPRTGMALLFVHEQKHESVPIERGRKYVLRSDILYTGDHGKSGTA